MDDGKRLTFSYDGIIFPFEIGDDEHIISDTVTQTGVWEENQLCLYEQLIPVNGTMLDVGANVGINSLFAKLKRPEARIIALEPEPQNFSRLQANCAAYGVELNNIAIADHEGVIGFAGTGTNAHVSAEGEHQVPCMALDTFVERSNISGIDLLKIDVEGFTDLVLSKSGRTLAMTRTAIIEFSHGDIVSRLQTLGLPDSEVKLHTSELMHRLLPFFPFVYYLSRGDGLVRLHDPDDLFEIMFCEAVVGDVLVTRENLPSISAMAFAFRNILELKRQNHLRMQQIMRLSGEVQ